MALPKLFNLITWHNNTTPAINEDNLNAMSQAIDNIDDRVIGLAGTIMEDVPQIQEDLEILEPAIENIDSNVERAETAADDAEDSAETAEYWANVSNPPIPVVKDFANVISVDDAIPKAATDVKVKIEAVQDLHGYTKPWVGGAGKNLLPLTVAKLKSANGGTWSGNSITKNGVTFTILTDSDGNVTGIKVSGTGSAETTFYIGFGSGQIPVGDYYANGSANGGGSNTFDVYFWNNNQGARVKQWDGTTNSISLDSSSVNAQIKIPNTTDSLSYAIRVKAGWNTNGMIFYPMIRKSTESDTSFEPYTNICPISGFTEAKIDRYRDTTITYDPSSNDKYIGADGTIGSSGLFHYTNLLPVVQASYKYRYTCTTSNNFSTRVHAYNENGVWLRQLAYKTSSGQSIGENKITFDVDSSVSYIRISQSTEVSDELLMHDNTQYIIDLDGTRYGATLDVDSGVMTVNKAIVDLGTLTYGRYDTQVTGKYRYISDGIASAVKVPASLDDKADIICSNYDAVNGYGPVQNIQGIAIHTNGNVMIYDETKATLTTDAFKSAMNGVQLLYPLATPITVQLTPTEVQMLQGYNVLSANSGDVYLEYDASMIQRIANEKLDISTFKSVVASSSDFADFKTKVTAL